MQQPSTLLDAELLEKALSGADLKVSFGEFQLSPSHDSPHSKIVIPKTSVTMNNTILGTSKLVKGANIELDS